MQEENRERREARFCVQNRHGNRPEAVGDPSLNLAPMDLHLVKKAIGGGKQVSTIWENREHQAVGKAVAKMWEDDLARVGEASNRGKGGLRWC